MSQTPDLLERIAFDGADYVDAFGSIRRLVGSTECDCCFEGVLEGEDADTGERWAMPYALPRSSVVASGSPAGSLPEATTDDRAPGGRLAERESEGANKKGVA